jgi:nucleoid-associated protein YgaU
MSMQRGTRVLLTVVLLAFVGVGTYYASQAPRPAEAERTDLDARASILPPAAVMVVEERTMAPAAVEAAPEAVGERAMPEPLAPPAAEAAAVAATRPVIEASAAPVRPVPALVPAASPLGVIEIGLPGEPAEGAAREHVVASGETLSSIAASLLGDPARWREIAAANPQIDADRLAVGDRLQIPSGSPPPVAPPRTAPPPAASPDAGREHTVAAGETLSSIAAARLGSSGRWREIYDLNRDRLASPDRLREGQRLRLPR